MNDDIISAHHRSRMAYVYIRQSSKHQVVNHLESQRRQRQLVERPLILGWHQDQVVTVDEDLGHSADRSQVRDGFTEMVSETAMGKVGIIFVIEISRLCRGNSDWYHLLDICAVTRTLIAEVDGLYDPRSYNDRLLLGLKGTMSETELHLMKQRLVESMRSKAARGEFRYRLPAGYIWDESGRMVKEPDAQIQSTIKLIFERFAELGSVHAAQKSFLSDGILVPTLDRQGSKKAWRLPAESYFYRMLSNPLYAGAYVWGRTQVVEELDETHRPIKRNRKRDKEKWPVLIKDHHEGYISWEMYERNQRQIASNRKSMNAPGAPREGTSLLQGLILCGQCGRRMNVRYVKKESGLRYECDHRHAGSGRTKCQSIGAIRLEREVERLVLEALDPLGVDAMLEAERVHEESRKSECEHFRHRVERARYGVDLARRQYDAVDPTNRLVAGELERRFEEALTNLKKIEEDTNKRIEALEKPLSESERDRLKRYARHLPSLWHAPTTRSQDKKRIVRCLIENVVIHPNEETSTIQANIHWRGGKVTPVEVKWRRRKDPPRVTDEKIVGLVRELAKSFSDSQIARVLIRKGFKSLTGKPFTRYLVANLRHRHNIEKGPAPPKLGQDDVYTAEQAGKLLGVDHATVIRWVEAGLLQGSQVTFGAPWHIRVTPDDIDRLTSSEEPKGWLTLKAAALALKVSQQTVLQRLKDGKLKGVRVKTGRRTAWRIQVKTEKNDAQQSLFFEPETKV